MCTYTYSQYASTPGYVYVQSVHIYICVRIHTVSTHLHLRTYSYSAYEYPSVYVYVQSVLVRAVSTYTYRPGGKRTSPTELHQRMAYTYRCRHISTDAKICADMQHIRNPLLRERVMVGRCANASVNPYTTSRIRNHTTIPTHRHLLHWHS
jgi:hypothetical protein